MDERRIGLRDLDDALLSGVLADQVIAGLARGGLDQRGRAAAEALARFADVAIAFRTGGLSAIPHRDVSAHAIYTLFARAAARTVGSGGSIQALRHYAELLARVSQLNLQQRSELARFLESLAQVSLEGARGTAGVLLSGRGEHRRPPWTRS
jgi:hypothetical protein